MTERGDGSPGHPTPQSRRAFFEEELGDAWVAQGDGTYRFVGHEGPLARDDLQEEAQPDSIDEAIERERRLLQLPWRRH